MSEITLQDLKNDLQDVLEIVTFLKDQSVTKDEFEVRVNVLRADLEQQLQALKSEIISHVDSFTVMHQKMEVELLAMRSKYERLEGQIMKIAKHVNIELA